MPPRVADPLMALINAATSDLDSMHCEGSGPICTLPTNSRPQSNPTQILDASSTASKLFSSNSQTMPDSFPETLMKILEDEDYSKIVTFLPDGHSFGIINAKAFSTEVMPRALGIRTFSSFVRKLRRWGFDRIMEKKTHDIDVFYHAQFRKGDWPMCRRIRCGGRQALGIESNQVKSPAPLNLFHQNIGYPGLLSPPNDSVVSQRLEAFSIQSVTSHVVGAALDALRRDDGVLDAPDIQHIFAHRNKNMRFMAQQCRQFIHYDTICRSFTNGF